jgi:signal transduction histidine kinase
MVSQRRMNTQALPSHEESSSASANLHVRRWVRFLSPSARIESNDIRRRVRLLLIVNITIVMFNLIGLVVAVIRNTSGFQTTSITVLNQLLAIIIVSIGYLLALTPRYRLGVWTTIVAIMMNAFWAMLRISGPEALVFVGLVMMGPIIASILLSLHETVQVSVVIGIGLVVTFYLHGPINNYYFPDAAPMRIHLKIISSFLFIAVSTSVITSMRLRDLLEKDRLAAQALAVQEKQRAEAFQQADQVKSAFLASMSHELRTPLNAVINFSKFLKKGIPGPVNEEQEQLLGNIADSGHHLLNLINDVLDMSKIEAGSLKLFVEADVDLKQTIETAISYTEPLLADKPVEIRQELPETLPSIAGDNKRLLQIFLNILSNACKFTDEGFIRVGAVEKSGHVVISIEDTGPGIAPEEHEGVFAAFKQTDSGLRQGSGTGLGMPICRKLVEAHNGHLWFESIVGVGTTFYVDFPLSSGLVPEGGTQ